MAGSGDALRFGAAFHGRVTGLTEGPARRVLAPAVGDDDPADSLAGQEE
jgi:hypothetical protein